MVFVISLMWAVMPDQYKSRFESITVVDASQDDGSGTARSASARVTGVILGVKMVIDRPIFGYGIGQFGLASYTFYDRTWWGQAHSLIGQLLGELGLVGLISFILWLTILFKRIRYIENIEKFKENKFVYYITIALRDQLLCLLFLGLGGHNLYRFNWYVVSALVIVIIALHQNESKSLLTNNNKSITR